MHPPTSGDDWVDLVEGPLPVEAATAWTGRPDCGAAVEFLGLVRDHAEGRDGVTHLDYEAYAGVAGRRMGAVVEELRQRWSVGRVAVLHRTGRVLLGEASVVVAVSSPHRAEAFEAARFAIDAVKASVPIWKRESWETGSGWATGSQPLVEAAEVGRSGRPSEDGRE